MTASYTYTTTVGQLVEQSLRKARIIAVEQTVQAADYERGRTSLNNVIKYLQSRGVHLWTQQRAVLPLVASQRRYLLGPSGANCGTEDTFYSTTLGAAGSTSDTVLTVASTANMVAAPNILASDPTDSTTDWTATNATLSTSSGLRVTNSGAAAGYADYTLPVTAGQTYVVRFSYTLGTSTSATISVLNGTTAADSTTLSASAAGQELTITAETSEITFRVANVSTTSTHYSTVYDLEYVDTETGSQIGILLDSGVMFWDYVLNIDSSTSLDLVTGLSGAAASGRLVYHFSEAIQRPLRLDNVTYGSTYTASEAPVSRMSRQEYMEQTDKDTNGTVVQFYYNPTLAQGELYVWQRPSSSSAVLRFDYLEPMPTYTATTDAVQFPSEWHLPLVWLVAADLGPEYGVSESRQAVLEGKAQAFLDEAEDNDSEDGSIFFEVGNA